MIMKFLIMTDQLNEDFKDMDKLLALMKTITRHKVDYAQVYKDKPMKQKTEIELIQVDLSKVFKYLTTIKIENARKQSINPVYISKAHNTCIELSKQLQDIKKQLIYSIK